MMRDGGSEWVDLGAGGFIVVCGRPRARRRHCYACPQPTARFCDFPVARRRTCDRPVCARHGRRVGEDQDFCLEHYGATRLLL